MTRKDLGQPIDLKEVIERLAQTGYSIVSDDQGGYDGYRIFVRRVEQYEITGRERDMLIMDGWITQPGASSWVLSDEGRKAYLRSTDELGDGKLVSPRD